MRIVFIGNDFTIFNSIAVRKELQITCIVSNNVEIIQLARQLGFVLLDLDSLRIRICNESGNLERPEIGICASFQILDQIFLDYPLNGFFNIHPAELPRFAGRYPFPSLVESKVDHSQATIHRMVGKADSGPIFAINNYEISPFDYYEDWHKSSARAGAQLLANFLDLALWCSPDSSGLNSEISKEVFDPRSRFPSRNLESNPNLALYDAIRINSRVGGTSLYKESGEIVRIFHASWIATSPSLEITYLVRNFNGNCFTLTCNGLIVMEITSWEGTIKVGDKLHRQRTDFKAELPQN